jgi:hypothetical protein
VLACGTVLEISPDDPVGGGDSAVDGPGLDGGPAPDAPSGADAAPGTEIKVGNVTVTLEPPVLDVLAGGPTASFTVKVERPANDTTAVTVSYTAPADLTVPSIAPITSFAASANVGASPTATPRRTVMNIQIQAGAANATLPLVFRIARDLRTAGMTSFVPEVGDGPQSYSVEAWGAGGPSSNGGGGGGGYVSSPLSVAGGANVIVLVGETGSAYFGGNPGGGGGGMGGSNGGGGGGYSGIFIGVSASFPNARVIAGAGGGGSIDTNGVLHRGGGGGSPVGGAAQDGAGLAPGGGASAAAGGTGGASNNEGSPGGQLFGGNGYFSDEPGGAGGGGYYGGGGGGHGSGGGGGASLVQAGGTSMPGTRLVAGNDGHARRMTAGDPGKQGAVLITPQ